MTNEGLSRGAAREGLSLLMLTTIAFTIQGVSTIVLARLLLPEGWGLYAMGLIPLALLSPVRDMGMPITVQYNVSKYGFDDSTYVKKAALLGVLWQVMIGTLLACALFGSSGLIATLLGVPNLHLVIASSVPILGTGGIFTTVYNLQIGVGKARIAGTLQIAYSLLKGSLSIILVAIGIGPVGAMLGFAIASLLIMAVSLALVVQVGNSNQMVEKKSILADLRTFLKYGLPLGVSELTATVVDQIVLFLGVYYITATEFGFFSAANTLASYIFAVFYPIIFVFLSAFAKLPSENGALESAYDKATHMSGLLIGSVGLVTAFFAGPIIIILFGQVYRPAGFLLYLFCLSDVILAPLGKYSSGSLLLARGYSKEFAIVNVATMIIIVPVAVMLLPVLGTIGVVLSIIIGRFISILGFGFQVKRKTGISFIRLIGLKLLAAFSISMIIVLLVIQLTSQIQDEIQILLVGPIALLVLLAALKITGGMTAKDLIVIREAVMDIPILGGVARFFLSFLERFF